MTGQHENNTIFFFYRFQSKNRRPWRLVIVKEFTVVYKYTCITLIVASGVTLYFIELIL